MFRLAGTKPASGQGLRGIDRHRNRLSLRRFSHAVDQTAGSLRMSSESDAQGA